ncbi:MAG: hypothetical protein ACYCT9_12800 [Leptospirillum sp.]
MRKEYDLTRLKVKRRAPLSGLHDVPEGPVLESGQVQVTMILDKDVTIFYEKKGWHRTKARLLKS